MAEKLTPEQQMAVDNRGGKLLVSAAAGSGKTKVLVDRLLKYIRDPYDSANIDEFLIITYTKAAASELRGKIAAKLSEHIAMDPGNRHLQRQMQRLYLTKISTVHSFCSDILREYAYKLDISGDFRVADENEVLQLRSRAMDQVLETAYANIQNDGDFQAFVDTQGLGRSDSLVPQIIEQVYDSSMCHLNPAHWCERCIASAVVEDITDPAQTVWGKYLLEDLFATLDDQIPAMDRCAWAVEAVPGLEKPAALLRDTANQLKHLRAATTWEQVMARKNIDYGRLTFSKKADDPTVTEPVKAVRKNCKELLEKKLRVFSDSGAKILEDLSQSAPAVRGLFALVGAFSEAYSRLKKQRRVLDFSDLEHKTLNLLVGKNRTGVTAAAREIGSRFREIMVDEYQDSNGVQDAIFTALTQQRQNLFMVGDVKQSIYQFRLADPGIFLEKYATFADASDAVPGEGRRVLLSSNFRSGGGVIEGANFVFRTCMTEAVGGIDYGDAEALREGIPHIPLDEPEVELHGIQVQEDTYAEEAAFVADRICQLTDGSHYVRNGDSLRPITLDDVVILLRSPGSVGMYFVQALAQRGIRCVTGAGADLLQAEEVITLRSLLQVISNPRQDIPLLSVLMSPVFGFTADDIAALRIQNRRCSIYEMLTDSEDSKAFGFLDVLNQLRSACVMGTLPELFERIFNLTRMDTVYSAMAGGQQRKENLRSFYQLASDYAGSGGDLDRFLTHLETLDERGVTAPGAENASNCVTLMSIHKSKGLEFPVVFLCGLARRFNQESTRSQVLCHKEMGIGLSCVDNVNRVRYPALSKTAIAARITAEGISEEMRVLYVAMTRARDRLIMTYASDTLDKDIADISMRMDISSVTAMTRHVHCPGQWVLYAALHRTEAGAFFALGSKPECSCVMDRPWKICVTDGFADEAMEEISDEPVEESHITEDTLNKLQRLLSFRYEHTAATHTPSKQTATQRKGRVKDQEAAENTSEPKTFRRTWREPTFDNRSYRGTVYGNAFHNALQYIRYENCTDEVSINKELDRLVTEAFITEEQREMVNTRKLYRFFASPMGEKLRTGEVVREFKFSILDDAAAYGDGLEGEQVLLQGVVDCALIEADGITVIDFKTDYVTEATVDELTAHYAPQVLTYADAMSRIYRMPVKKKALYFFGIDCFVWLP